MNVEAIIGSLSKVRRTGPNNWLACCPAHEDSNPSMTLHAPGDGRILAFCHSGCTFDAIVGAVGLGWHAWFPEGVTNHPVKAPYPAADVLEALAFEATVVAIVASDIAAGKTISQEDKDRVLLAYQRINESRDVALGKRKPKPYEYSEERWKRARDISKGIPRE